MGESNLTSLSGSALFSPADFCEVNQLADLLFNPEDQAICLLSEHEFVTRAWVLSALKNSQLAKKGVTPPTVVWASSDLEKPALFPRTWIYVDGGKVVRANGAASTNPSTLYLPSLTLELRIKVVQQICIDNLQTHLLTIPLHTIKKALEWQARYCAHKQVLTETILLIQRAVNRFLLTHAEDKQAAFLEPHHIAEVLVDWQHVSLCDLLRPTEDATEWKRFLSEYIVGQNFAIESFIQTRSTQNFFILAGTQYSGKKTFIEHVAQFTLGAKCFCIPFNLSFFSSDTPWSSIFLPAPHKINDNSRLNLLEIVEKYPQAVIMITHAHENPELLDRLLRQIKRSFFQIDGQCISIAGITWMTLLDVAAPVTSPAVIQESIFSVDNRFELSDILYRPSIGPVAADEINQTDEKYAFESVKNQFSETVLASACVLPFLPLTEKDKKQIINKEIKRIIDCLRSAHDVPVYYQEEIVQFLLTQVNQAEKGFETLHKNLHHQIEHVLSKALESGALIDGQVLMLQLNDTGRVLQIVRTMARTTSTTQSQTMLKI